MSNYDEANNKCEQIFVHRKKIPDHEVDLDSRSNIFKITLSSLPDELLLRILKFLLHSDLSSCILLNRKFRSLASDPVLWKKYSIPAMEIAQTDGLAVLLEVLKLPRFKKLQVLDLNRVYLGAGLMQKKCSGIQVQEPPESSQQFLDILKVASSLPLTWLDLSYNNLAALPSPDLVTKIITNISSVELFATCRGGVSSDFICSILEEVSEKSVLRSINLGACDLDTLPVSLVVKLNCMSNVTLEGSFVTVEQAKALMIEMGKVSKIKRFEIGSEPIIDIETLSDVLENLEPEIVAKALNNVEYLKYNKVKFSDGDCCDLDPDIHLATFLEEMGRSTKLKQVEMEENNFFFVPPRVVAKAFNNLEYLEFKPNPNNTSEQIVATLERMSQKTMVVKLKFIFEDLSWLNPGLVARAVVMVEQVDMLCNLSRAHVRAILGQLDDKSRLKRLNMGSNDVSKVPKHILENAFDILRKNGGQVVALKKGKKVLVSYS